MSPRPSPLSRAVSAFTSSARSEIRRLVLAPYVAGTELPSLSGSRFEPLAFGRDELAEYRSELITSLSAFRWRLWCFRSLVLLVRTLLIAAGLLLAATALEVTGLAPSTWWLPLLVGLAVAGGLALIFWQRLSYFDVARVVDRQLGLKAQLGTAIQLSLEAAPSQIARSQVRQATTIARRLEPSQAVTFRMPWRDLRMLATVLASTVAISLLASLGVRAPLPEPAGAASEAAVEPAPDSWYEVDPVAAAELGQEGQASDFQSVIAKLQEQLDRQEITPLEYASQVAAVEDQIRQQAEESSRQQAALGDLADSLSDSSSTRGVAEHLRRGAYAEAVQELADVSQQTDRLSAQAQQELADRLGEAAQSTRANNPEIAAAAERAAAALRSGDSDAAQEALRDLAGAVAEASQSVAPQSDLGEALQQLEEAQGQLGDLPSGAMPGAEEGAPSEEARSGSAPGDEGLGSGEAPNGSPPEGGRGQDGAGAGAAEGQGGGAGAGRGERIIPFGSPAEATKPEITGNVLKITGKPSNAGSTIRAEGSGPVPLTSPGTGTTSIQGSGGTLSSDPVNTLGENNYVPLERKPIVKDYFSGGDR